MIIVAEKKHCSRIDSVVEQNIEVESIIAAVVLSNVAHPESVAELNIRRSADDPD